eukprot:3461758-Karenia_brevis.AAC.1
MPSLEYQIKIAGSHVPRLARTYIAVLRLKYQDCWITGSHPMPRVAYMCQGIKFGVHVQDHHDSLRGVVVECGTPGRGG